MLFYFYFSVVPGKDESVVARINTYTCYRDWHCVGRVDVTCTSTIIGKGTRLTRCSRFILASIRSLMHTGIH